MDPSSSLSNITITTNTDRTSATITTADIPPPMDISECLYLELDLNFQNVKDKMIHKIRDYSSSIPTTITNTQYIKEITKKMKEDGFSKENDGFFWFLKDTYSMVYIYYKKFNDIDDSVDLDLLFVYYKWELADAMVTEFTRIRVDFKKSQLPKPVCNHLNDRKDLYGFTKITEESLIKNIDYIGSEVGMSRYNTDEEDSLFIIRVLKTYIEKVRVTSNEFSYRFLLKAHISNEKNKYGKQIHSANCNIKIAHYNDQQRLKSAATMSEGANVIEELTFEKRISEIYGKY